MSESVRAGHKKFIRYDLAPVKKYFQTLVDSDALSQNVFVFAFSSLFNSHSVVHDLSGNKSLIFRKLKSIFSVYEINTRVAYVCD